ncbi:MAG: glycosyltransferase [Planctomycetota bacterium]
MDIAAWFATVFGFMEHVIIFYVGAINSTYFLLTTLGYFALRRSHGNLSRSERDSLLRSSLVPAVSVLAPAYNESATVKDSVRALLRLHYPNYEVIVINDGSKDATMQVLTEEFHLYKSSRRHAGSLATKRVRAVYESRDPIRLVVIDKENGGKADALNAGLNAARSPLVAAIDSDSLLEPDALLAVTRPFLEDPERTVAAGGIVRVVNGCDVQHGTVTRIAAPPSLLARFQAVEYLRAFLGGRVAFSFMNALMLISGAFGLFRRDVIMKAGGFLATTVGEDMELVVRLHRLLREQKRDYRIVFVPEPICWTEVPERWRTLYRQRNRWQRGTVESLWRHRRMMLNPDYGMAGLAGFPYFALFEMIGPAIELLGYVLTVAGLALRIISWDTAIVFFAMSVLFGILLSISAITLEEATTRRYPSPADVAKLFVAAVIENLGFRQLLTVWRTKGLIDALRKKRGWGRWSASASAGRNPRAEPPQVERRGNTRYTPVTADRCAACAAA